MMPSFYGVIKNQIGLQTGTGMSYSIPTLRLGASWGGVVIFNVPKKLGLLKPRM